MSDRPPSPSSSSEPRWQPLEAIDRRVVGVLIEKAKTTSDNYPLSLNALRGGCNQKSNRFPQMQLEEDPLEESLERLRLLGVVAFIQGGSRVDKYRHLAYEWLGVDKVELAVMAELLLRGAQTIGELRGRAARMEPIKGLDELRPILDSLEAKGLIHYLSPKGRGAVVTHALYLDRELDKVRREYGDLSGGESYSEERASEPPAARPIERPAAPVAPRPDPPMQATSSPPSNDLAELIRGLRDEVSRMRAELNEARAEVQTSTDQLRQELDDLNRQLGN
jgi:hypothetical protein